MLKFNNGGFDQYGKVYNLNGIGGERVNLVLFIGYVIDHWYWFLLTDGHAQFSDNVWPDSSTATRQQHPGDGPRQRRPVPYCWKHHHSCMSYLNFTYYLSTYLCTILSECIVSENLLHGHKLTVINNADVPQLMQMWLSVSFIMIILGYLW